MHTREYAATALAELEEELDRLVRLDASAGRLATAYAHSAGALRQLVSDQTRPWLEDALARIRGDYALEDCALDASASGDGAPDGCAADSTSDSEGPLQAGIDAVAGLIAAITPDAAPGPGVLDDPLPTPAP